MRTNRSIVRRAVVAAQVLFVTSTATAQAPADFHPAKQAYADYPSWPVVAPGTVRLANFRPFRAVYERHYRDTNGQHREDRVIVTAEHVAWGPEAAIMVSLVDAGSPKYSDTNARNQFRIFSREEGQILLQVAPAPGTALHYQVIRFDRGRFTRSVVNTDSGKVDFQEMRIEAGGWGAPPHWIAASLPLEVGKKIRIEPVYAVATSAFFIDAPFRVVGQEWVEAAGERVHAWVIEHPIGPQGPRLMRTWVTDRPPYVLGRQSVNAETGENPLIGSMRLISLQAFESLP